MTGKVYFIECAGRIKVGYSKNVKERMETISTGAPNKLELIAAIDGDYRLEKAIHRYLKSYRAKGEWFEDCTAVRSAIEHLIARGPDAIGFVHEDPPEKKQPSGVQLAINAVIRKQRPFGTKPWQLVSEVTGVGERAAKHRLSNAGSYSIEDIRALFRTDNGFAFLKAIMADAKPEWWKPVRNRRPPRSINHQATAGRGA